MDEKKSPQQTTQQATPPPPVNTYIPADDPHGPLPKYIPKRVAFIALIFIAAIFVISLVKTAFDTVKPTEQQIAPTQSISPTIKELTPTISQEQIDAKNAAEIAAMLPTNRSEVIDPTIIDDPADIPVYPPNTRVEMDTETWKPNGDSATAEAEVRPLDIRILIHFSKHEGKWYMKLIERI